jgi:hypothetical protein
MNNPHQMNQTSSTISRPYTRLERSLLRALTEMVNQHLSPEFDDEPNTHFSGFISSNCHAFDMLVREGILEYIREPLMCSYTARFKQTGATDFGLQDIYVRGHIPWEDEDE